jgi:predicted DsbA family dithiol-disulfide isomerase
MPFKKWFKQQISIIAMSQTIKIDIVSDVACPWCYIGQERLRKAMEALPHIDFQVEWKPFQLQPDMPAEGADKVQFMAKKFGPKAKSMEEHVSLTARQEGLPIDFDKMTRMPNTLQAHRLMAFGKREGIEHQMAYLLFKAYFADGKLVGEKETLLGIGQEAGLSEASLDKFMNTDEGLEEVRYEEHHYRQAGINSVPSFIINDQYLVQGAQPSEVLIDAFEQVAAIPEGKGHACHDGHCDC